MTPSPASRSAEGRPEPTRVPRDSFEEFYARERPSVLGLARVLTGSHEMAEDVTHDAFTAALTEWGTLRDPGAWIRRVVTNRARSGWRRKYAERRTLARLARSEDSTYELPEETESFWWQVRQLRERPVEWWGLG